ncbi:rasGEF domain-containing protein [Naegleria gruberi]|uniref:RasGEF domain-containing protein n=1 Tax=Naegleria gruberi TaxID=5762 RepID=D2VY93_NAEGR|nr:rasGEF domain-containing protein [Naegleria gruberi]EFC38209.1 rasGEF domain-containing protein [Naegleria gruberi]|eukprot:XP_002670953.1 rasGEF domain-containing protein [Naegleria gruberi strain NEG-M]
MPTVNSHKKMSNSNTEDDTFITISTNEESINKFFDLDQLLDNLRQFPVVLLKTVNEIAEQQKKEQEEFYPSHDDYVDDESLNDIQSIESDDEENTPSPNNNNQTTTTTNQTMDNLVPVEVKQQSLSQIMLQHKLQLHNLPKVVENDHSPNGQPSSYSSPRGNHLAAASNSNLKRLPSALRFESANLTPRSPRPSNTPSSASSTNTNSKSSSFKNSSPLAASSAVGVKVFSQENEVDQQQVSPQKENTECRNNNSSTTTSTTGNNTNGLTTATTNVPVTSRPKQSDDFVEHPLFSPPDNFIEMVHENLPIHFNDVLTSNNDESIRQILNNSLSDHPALQFATRLILDEKQIVRINNNNLDGSKIKNQLDWDLEMSAKAGLNPITGKQLSDSTSTTCNLLISSQIGSTIVPISAPLSANQIRIDDSPYKPSLTPSASLPLTPKRLKARSNTTNNVLSNPTVNVAPPASSSFSPISTNYLSVNSQEYLGGKYSSASNTGLGMILTNSGSSLVDPRRSDVDLETLEVDVEEEEEEEIVNTELNFREVSEKMYEETSNRVASIYNPFYRLSNLEEDVCKRGIPSNPFQVDQSLKILINAKGLIFENTDINLEPLYATLYLYDKKTESRISEEFNFTLNTGMGTLTQLGIEKSFPKDLLSTEAKMKAIFSVKDKNPNIYLVLWVKRIFSDNSYVDNTYLAKKKIDESSKKSYLEKLKTAYSFLDQFKSPLICAVEPLFEEKRESVTSNELKVSIEEPPTYEVRKGAIIFDKLFVVPHLDGKKQRCNVSSLIEHQRDYSKQKGTLKVDNITFKNISAKFTMLIDSNPDNISKYHQVRPLYDTGVHEVKAVSVSEDNADSFTFDDDETITMSFNTFSHSSKSTTLFTTAPKLDLTFNHVLYILLDNINMTSLPNSYKSVAVRVLLRENDEMSGGVLVGASRIFSEGSRNYIGGMDIKQQAISSITYHEKYPLFFDQIKIQLPFPIHDNHHLVFEFRHVSSKRGQPVSGVVGKADTTVIGFSILKLVQDEGFKNGMKKLPIYKCTTLPNNYLSDKSLQKYANGKSIFRFNVIAKSSIFPSDKNAVSLLTNSGLFINSKNNNLPKGSFLSQLNDAMSLSDAESILKNFQKAHWSQMLYHFPVFLNCVMYIIANVKTASLQNSTSSEIQNNNSVSEKTLGIAGFVKKRTATLTSRTKNVESVKETTTSTSTTTTSLSLLVFETLLHMLRGMRSNSRLDYYERDQFLNGYIYYMFKNPPTPDNTSFCLLLAERWEEFFKSCHTKETESRTKESNSNTTESSGASSSTNDSVANRPRRATYFSKPRSNQSSESQESTVEEINALDSLKLSWFLFDTLVKSMKLYILEGKKQDVFTEVFYTKMRSLQTKLMERLLTASGDPIKLHFVKVVNRHLALFMCDLLEISLMKEMKDDVRFRKFVKTALNDYVLTTQFKSSPVVVGLKFDFAEIIIDSSIFVEVNMCSETPFLLKFVIGILQKANKPDLRTITLRIINRLIVKLDSLTKFSSADSRNEICKLVMPLFFEIAHVEKLLRNMDNDLQSHFAVSFVHCLRNRKKEEWPEIWNHKSPDVLVSFVKLLSIAINKHIAYPVRVTRRMIKTIVIEILVCFIEQKWELMIMENEKYSPVIEEVLLLIMKYIEQFNQSSQDAENVRKRMDPMLTNTMLTPLFVTIVQKLIPVFSIDIHDDRWKWALGTLLSVCCFPLSQSENESYILESIDCLLISHQAKLENIEKNHEKLILTEDSEKNYVVENNQIKAATLDKLIEKITSDKETDPKFRDVFFLTYRSFCSSHVLMDKLIDRFNIAEEQKKQDIQPEANTKVLLRVINAVKMWVEKYFHDFDNLLLVRLIQFLDSVANIKEFSSFCNALRKTLSNKLIKDNDKAVKHAKQTDVPDPIIPENFSEHVAFNILEWSPIEIARQITLIEYEYFQKIEPKECLSGAWTKSSKYDEAPNIAHLTDRWNKMTQFVACSILSQNDLKIRRRYIIKFIELANALRDINNFHGLSEILSGLSNVSVYRLKKTWATVPTEYLTLYEDLKKLCSQEQANKNMRQALQLCLPPCIPPLSMYLKDLTFINDGNPDYIRDGLINVFKRRQVSKIILEIRQYQMQPYYFETVDFIKRIINQIQTVTLEDYKLYTSGVSTNPSIQSLLSLGNIQLVDEDTLWDRSLELEPRQPQQ